MTRAIGWFCLICLAVSIAVHAVSYVGIVRLATEDGAGLLQLAVMLAWLLAWPAGVVAVRRVQRERSCAREEASQVLFARLSRSAVALGALVFIYTWVLGVWFFFGVEHGTPRRSDDGGFVLENRGRNRSRRFDTLVH